MYALAGILSKNGRSISQDLISMLQEQSTDKKGHYGLVVENKVFNGKLNDLNVKAIEGSVGLGCVPLKRQYAPIYRDCLNKLSLIYDGLIYDFKKKLSKDHNLVKTTDADIITHLLEENFSGGDLAFAAKKTLGHLEGGFSVATTDNNDIVAARDPVGFRTLYYGENDSFYAIATTKKALWRVGIPTVFRLPAGSMIHINKNFIDVSKIFPEERFGVEISIKDPRTAVDRYQEALCAAVGRMLNGLDKAAILLSGGVDSCLLAKVLKDKSEKLDVDLVGYTIGLEGSSDLKFAEDFAKQIGLPVKSKTVTIDDLNEALPKVICAVEERDYVQIETSLIPYLAIEQVAKDSISVVFLGQGPDEMWGGYPWYPRLLKEWGYAKLHETMWEDLIRGDVETLARENKVARMFDVEVRYPYLDIDVIKTAMSVAPQIKIISDKDALGKRIHRSLAKKLGLPADACERKKTAAQHGSGIHQVLLQLANRHGFDDKLVARLNYSPTKISTENLGSSSRYGYKYGDRDMWLIPSCIQLYFDYLAYKEGLLNDPERTKISTVLRDIQSFDQDVKQLIKR